ncbi:hypothetical protein [Oceanidesulfovibrio indonesiensis]|nr:hypothetical protein [Oceanidesulfovibrio indonesiensis]
MSISFFSSRAHVLPAAVACLLIFPWPDAHATANQEMDVDPAVQAIHDFITEFEAMPRRDPFKPVQLQEKNVAQQQEKASIRSTLEGIIFDGTMPQEAAADLSRMPRIRVTGLMKVDGRIAACAEVENLGSRILHPGDRILLDESRKHEDRTKWFTVKSIDDDGMLIELDDNQKIRGKFF